MMIIIRLFMANRIEKKNATRERILSSASRQLKVEGFKGTSVQSVMAEADLTHGSFYAYFKDKKQMIVEALRWAVQTSHKRVDAQLNKDASAGERLRGFLYFYLSPLHRQNVAEGCPIASLSRDFAQADVALRTEFAKGMRETIENRRALFSPQDKEISKEEWMGIMSCYIGGLILSRACEGDPLSDQFLEAAFHYIEKSTLGEIP